jgi:hypothetical protein
MSKKMTKKEILIKEVSEYFDDYERGGAGGCAEHHCFKEYIIEIIEKVFAVKKRELSELEIRVGRSESYHKLSASEQWAEDKRKGILDWDGSKQWLDDHGK